MVVRKCALLPRTLAQPPICILDCSEGFPRLRVGRFIGMQLQHEGQVPLAHTLSGREGRHAQALLRMRAVTKHLRN